MKQLHGALTEGYLRQHWRRLSLYGFGTVIGVLIVVQLIFPWSNLPLYETIDGVAVGNKSADETIKLLNDKYKNQPIKLYFGTSPKPYREPKPADLGMTIDTKPQVDAAAYPLWLRLVPTSLWWVHAVLPSPAPSYKHDSAQVDTYVKKELGQSCLVTAENATLLYKDNKLQIVSAIDGGTCKLEDVQKLLTTIAPRLTNTTVRVPMDQHPAKIHDDEARTFMHQVTDRTKNVLIKAGNETVTVPQNELLSWLDFAAPDSGLAATVNAGRSAEFFTKQLTPKISVKPGVSRITTLDFTVVDQVFGATGQTLDTDAMLAQLNKWLGGDTTPLSAPAKPVAATKSYIRTYTKTDTGLAALLQQFAEAHSGTFGVSYAELSGAGRHAGYNDTRVFETASTYKLFVAYGALKRIESGQWHWSDQIDGGRDLTKCFDDMIVKSDNACAKAMLTKIGYSTLTNELRAIGLTKSSFLGSYIQSTPADEAMFLGALQTGQLLSPSSTNTLLSAMKRNIYRQGIPAGASGTVADKVGFLYALLHDASIVYSPTGTYVLVIMTDGSSWGTIAELTRQIEAWRAS